MSATTDTPAAANIPDDEVSLLGTNVVVIGSGAIATGVAAAAAAAGAHVTVTVRSEEAAGRAEDALQRIAERAPAQFPSPEIAVRDARVEEADVVIEAVVEDLAVKVTLLGRLGRELPADALLASTTSSLSVAALAEASGVSDRFFGFHVFNPVPRMELVELVFGPGATEATRRAAREFCVALKKQPIEAPDIPGFVVNRLLFPYLFSAVRLMEDAALEPADIDTAMTLGAGHPMGPLALLDFVGLDVAAAIGDSLGLDVPRTIRERIAEGRRGRKSGGGIHGVGHSSRS